MAFIALSLAAFAALTILWSMPPLAAGTEPREAAFDLADNEGAVYASRGVSRGDYVSLDSLPGHLVQAVLSMEDRRFYTHPGLDLRGVLRAMLVNWRSGGVEQGGSTITQQLAKISYLPHDRTYARKAQEAVIALWLEARLSKDEILERYLNNIYLGAGSYGVESAARRYFGKPASELTLAESAMMAGLIQAPSRTSPVNSYETAVGRARVALGAMAENGEITVEEAADAAAHPAELARPPAEVPIYGYAADYAADRARMMVGGAGGDFQVQTTIDPRLQALADQTIREALENALEGGPSQAAMVAMTYDGAILAMTGGRDYSQSAFNRAVQAERQPGSTFKLFVYLAALQQNFSPATMIDDAPIRIGDYTPENYGGRFHGRVSLLQAFAQSMNGAAVRVQEAVGRENVIRLARRMGLQGELKPEPSLALGAREATLLNLTAAYTAVAADRERVNPSVISAISAPGGGAFAPPMGDSKAAPWPREEALQLLRAVVQQGTGRAAALQTPAYGKTGTTSDYRDAWFIGFSEGVVTGIWMGNDDNSPMTARVTGGGLPARTWKTFMQAALSGELPEAQPRTSDQRRGPQPLAGHPEVINTGTLRIDGQVVRLEGVEGLGQPHAAEMQSYLGEDEVACRVVRLEAWRCEVRGFDLSEVVVFNGAGRAAPDAPGLIQDAERKARQAGRGVWGQG